MTQASATTLVLTLSDLLDSVAPDNTAPFPLSITRATDTGNWEVNLHIRIPGQSDFSIERTHPVLTTALTRATGALQNLHQLIRENAYFDERFGVRYDAVPA